MTSTAASCALRRLQEVGVNVLAPAQALADSPLADAVAIKQLAVAAAESRAGGVQLPSDSSQLCRLCRWH